MSRLVDEFAPSGGNAALRTMEGSEIKDAMKKDATPITLTARNQHGNAEIVRNRLIDSPWCGSAKNRIQRRRTAVDRLKDGDQSDPQRIGIL